MTQTIDCRNMACPEPVIRTKEALEAMEEGILDVQLNTFSSIQNVKRFVTNEGLYFEQKKVGSDTVFSIVKGYECGIEGAEEPSVIPHQPKTTSKRSFLALIVGAIVTAILASTCCIAPFLFLLFGVGAGSLSFLKPLAPYHNFFLLIAAGVIVYLWYHYFTAIRKMIVCEGWICKYYLRYLSVGTVLVLVFLTYQYWVVYFFQ